MHICACLYSIFSGHSLWPESSSQSWSNPVGRACHIACSRPRHIAKSEVQVGPVQARGMLARGTKWQTCPGPVWSDSGLGRRCRAPCQELSLRAPVLRPCRPGSVTVTCVGAGHGLLYQGLWQLLWLRGWLPRLPTRASFTGGSSLTSHGLSSSCPPMSFAYCIYLLWQVGDFWRN